MNPEPANDVSGNGRLASRGTCATFEWALRSEPGSLPVHNEDYAAVYASEAPDHAWDRGPLFVVADGLGGHAAGEVASRLATESTLAHWTAPGIPAAAQQSLRTAVRAANVAVFDASLERGQRGMGTTIVAATLAGRQVIVAHVGDSRAYLVQGDRCSQLTTDHSRVAEMVRMKLLTPEQAANHPSRSMLTRSLGADHTVQVELSTHPIAQGDVVVLCSDGMWDLVARHELVAATAAPNPPERASAQLVDLAIERGAPDNVTVVMVRVTSAEPVPAAQGRRSLFGRRRG